MTGAEALDLIRAHGVVLASAKGPVPALAEGIAGEPIKGSWMGSSSEPPHTASGRHVNHEVPFPDGFLAEVMREAQSMSEAAALAGLGTWAQSGQSSPRGASK